MFEWLLFCGVLLIIVVFLAVAVWFELLKEGYSFVSYTLFVPYVVVVTLFIKWCLDNLRFAFTFVWG